MKSTYLLFVRRKKERIIMKQWNMPEVKDLAISNTEYFAFTGKHQDGQYVSNDGKYYTPTYSGDYKHDVPFNTATPASN